MVCPRCGKQNEADAQFCAKCGRNLAEVRREQMRATDGDEGRPCYRHPKVLTGLSCGRCDRPICTKCAILGPAGPRCPDCAKSQVAVRPAAVMHSGKRAFRSLFSRGPLTIYLVVILTFAAINFFRNCEGPQSAPPRTPPPASNSAR